MRKNLSIWILALCYPVLLFFTACKKDAATTNIQIPVVLIGRDTIVDATTTALTLDGSASYAPNGKIVEYGWMQISGPNNVSFSNAASAKTVVANLIPGIYRFGFAVTNNRGVIANGEKKVMVGREFVFENLVWEEEYVDDFDTYVVSLVSPARPDLFMPEHYYNPAKPLGANVYVSFDTASNWLNIPLPVSNSTNSDFYYRTDLSRVIITTKNFRVLKGRKASIKVEF